MIQPSFFWSGGQKLKKRLPIIPPPSSCKQLCNSCFLMNPFSFHLFILFGLHWDWLVSVANERWRKWAKGKSLSLEPSCRFPWIMRAKPCHRIWVKQGPVCSCRLGWTQPFITPCTLEECRALFRWPPDDRQPLSAIAIKISWNFSNYHKLRLESVD